MVRPSFSVAALTLCLLVLFGFLRRGLGPMIPSGNPVPPGATLFERAGARQAIRWQPFGPDALRQAKQRGLPILLFLGRSSSPSARALDRETLMDRESVRLIGTRFIACRLDLARYPHWADVLFPISRTAGWTDSGCQLIALDPSGRLVAAIVPVRIGPTFGRNE
ncbi:MAG: hypothetical protein C4320_08925, partial [Armatimonadota bacterium]